MDSKVGMGRIAFAYVGTVVGAGFATGKEVFVFFTKYGAWGNIGILLALVLFIVLGYRMMWMGHQLQATSYADLNYFLFGRRWGRWFTALVSVTLFGITAAMLSGVGSSLQTLAGPQVILAHGGTFLVILLTYQLAVRQLKGVLVVNTWIVPLMLVFTVVIAWVSLPSPSLFWEVPLRDSIPLSLPPLRALWSALLYVSFNLATAQAVLVPLGAAARDRRTLRYGAILGGTILGIMLWSSQQCLQFHIMDWDLIDVPMAEVVRLLHPVVYGIFLVVLIAEIVTTLVGNLYGLAVRCMETLSFRLSWAVIFLLVGSYFFSLLGFSTMVKHIYPLLGYGGLGLCLALVTRRLLGPRGVGPIPPPVGKEGEKPLDDRSRETS